MVQLGERRRGRNRLRLIDMASIVSLVMMLLLVMFLFLGGFLLSFMALLGSVENRGRYVRQRWNEG